MAGEDIPDRLFLKKVELGARATHSLTVDLALAICNEKRNKTSDDFIRSLLSVHKLLEADGGPGPAAAAAAVSMAAKTATVKITTTKITGSSSSGGGGGDNKSSGDKSASASASAPHPNFHAQCGNTHVGGDDKCRVVHPELKPAKWSGGGKNKSTATAAASSQSPVRGGEGGGKGEPVILRVDYRVL